MLVYVTGGTGFVGSHSIAAIVKAGCRVRMLVRDPAAVGRALAPLGVDPDVVEFTVGDVTDEATVGRTVRGADAVLHAASVYSFDSRRREQVRRANIRGTEVVLGAAERAGAGPIVHVSTVGALMPSQRRVVNAQTQVARPRQEYLWTKAVADMVARHYQRKGAPVVISYPPALLGPHDPHLGDQTTRLRDQLRGLMPVWPTGGFPLGDVRDTAELHAALVTGKADDRSRQFAPNHYVTTRQYVAALREATGRLLPTVYLPARALLPLAGAASLLQRVWPWHIPAEYGAVYVAACATRVDESELADAAPPRPIARTMADTVRWLFDAGLLSARQAGRAGRAAIEDDRGDGADPIDRGLSDRGFNTAD